MPQKKTKVWKKKDGKRFIVVLSIISELTPFVDFVVPISTDNQYLLDEFQNLKVELGLMKERMVNLNQELKQESLGPNEFSMLSHSQGELSPPPCSMYSSSGEETHHSPKKAPVPILDVILTSSMLGSLQVVPQCQKAMHCEN